MKSMIQMTINRVLPALLSSHLGVDSPNARTFVSVQTNGNIAFATNLRHLPLPTGMPPPNVHVFDFDTVLIGDLQAVSDARRAAALAREQRLASAAARAESPAGAVAEELAGEQVPTPVPKTEQEIGEGDDESHKG